MPTGEPFTDGQLAEVDRVLAAASAETGLLFSVFVGEPEGTPRDAAETMHAALGPTAASAVLVLVAPGSRRLEIVTGRDVRHRLPDRVCGLAALSMASAFTGGDLVGGITSGVLMLAEAAGRVPVQVR
ncbi:MAG TPA: DUF5130 family protein [Mycobacteriales bacterium]|nr:DUF5130 family protein [Mycobacteriales bacterium]